MARIYPKRVFCIDKGCGAAKLLGLGNHVQGHGGFT